jgi:transcriptional regulator
MYIPPSYAEPNAGVMLDYVEAHPLGVLVTASSEGLFATHLPMVVDRSRGERGTLLGHIAKANPHHRRAALGEALVIFSGPDAYVTPAWYASKQEHGKVVPTWNYAAVHAYGAIRFVEDESFLRAHLHALVARHERGRDEPWEIEDAPEKYIDQQVRAIVGVEVAITRLEGKWKMSQNRPAADIDGVVRGLGASPDPTDRAVASLVDERRPGSRAV